MARERVEQLWIEDTEILIDYRVDGNKRNSLANWYNSISAV